MTIELSQYLFLGEIILFNLELLYILIFFLRHKSQINDELQNLKYNIIDFQKRVYLFQKHFELFQQNFFIILVEIFL